LARAQVPQQQAAIGIITLFSRDSAFRGVWWPSFLAALAELGLVEGRNLRFEYSAAEGRYDRLPTLAAELVDKRVTVIVALSGEDVAVKVKAAAPTTPIVSLFAGDPVERGLVGSLNRPGGNVTGVNIMTVQLTAKQMHAAARNVASLDAGPPTDNPRARNIGR
jgi:putative ABC transport system substrate-binding protein